MDYDDYMAARRPQLVRSAVLLGCPIDDAEDIVQTVMMKCFSSWRRIQGVDRINAYVYAVLVNTWRDARARKWNGEVPSEEVPETAIESDETVGLAVWAALRQCSPDHREVLVLRYFADLTEKQTARILGVSVGTVKSRSSRAIEFLAGQPQLKETEDAW